jgi:uncharacterized protein YaiE (UPF0345 family)
MGDGERIVATAIIERFAKVAGALELLTPGSTRAVTQTGHTPPS